MILLLPEVHLEHIILLQPVKNTIIHNSVFSKIIYSDDCISLDAIYVKQSSIKFPTDFEHSILNLYSTSKRHVVGLEKYMAKHPLKPILKISGIWETDTAIGLVTKLD
jgi:hypothetical protein